jgi:uncharacterized protein (TIGR02145 family)
VYTITNIEGFRLDRKIGNGEWETGYRTFPKEVRLWNDTDIKPDESLTYYYRLCAYAGKYQSAYDECSIKIAFPAPEMVTLEQINNKKCKITWVDMSTGEKGFKIDHKVGDANWEIGYGVVGENKTSFTDTNMFMKVDIKYRVYAYYDDFGSKKVEVNTTGEIAAPTNLIIVNNTITSLKLTWKDNSNNETGFRIEKKYEGGNWESLASVNKNFYIDEDIELNTLIYYRVSAFIGNYYTPRIEKSYTANVPPPQNMQTIHPAITEATISWQYDYSDGDGFKIERKYEGSNWEQLATTTGQSYQDNGFELNTTVYYRICAFKDEHNSSWIETNFDSHMPAPSNFHITANSATSVTLTWDYNFTGYEGFKIDRKINEGTWELIYATVTTGKSFSDNGLDLTNNVYYYHVYAFFDQFESSKVEVLVNLKCSFPFTDNRDGKEYQTVQIGDQCWMKENLAYLPSVSPSSNGSQTSKYYYVYGYPGTNVTEAKATTNYQTYGVLYNWPASLTACPDGWHLPSDAEWTTLTTYVSSQPEYLCNSLSGYIAKALAATTNWNSSSYTCDAGNNISTNNATGFSGLPGGSRYGSGSFSYIGYNGFWWSATEYSSTVAWRRSMFYNLSIIDRYIYSKECGFSVRCLRDL